ncbi:MAG: type II toxin-antitoxin system RelE/ParE family toxin [Planctomycetales bacterium]|nr:type II toxin-antitoxin system RelE/ParE family toxin [Planctomycetales bacterium]
MTRHVVWSPQAVADWEQILHYIAVEQERPLVAERLAVDLRAACQPYAAAPEIGQAEPRLPQPCRRFTFKRWVVLYQPHADGIAVLRVVDAARDFDRLFG